MLTLIKINSVDVSSSLISWEIEKSHGAQLNEATIKFVKSVNTTQALSTGLILEGWRGYAAANEEKVFDGYIEKFEPDGGLITVTGLDQLWNAVRKEINTVYDSDTHVTAGRIDRLFQHLINVESSAYNSTGTNDAVTASKLRDSTAAFDADGTAIGDNVWNESKNTWTTVTAIDSAIQLSLTDDIFPVADGTGITYVIKPVAAMIADDTSVQSTGSTIILEKFVCNHTDPFERCKKLAEVMEWQFYYKANDNKVYFEPKGYTVNTNTFTVGTNILSVPAWQVDNTELVNDLTINGAFQEVETTESGEISVTAGYTTTGITLSYEPLSVKVYGDAADPPTTLKVGGVPDSTGAYDYYVDKDRKKILPKSGTTFTANHNYEIRYSLKAPIPVNLYNQTSIDSYGRFQKTITFTDVRSVADAEQRGTLYLESHKDPFVYTTLKIKNLAAYALDVGQRISVVDNVSSPAINDTFVVNTIRWTFPTSYDEVDVGTRFWRLSDFNSMVMEKFKRLEEEQFANLDIVNKIVTIDNRTVSPIIVQNRYHKVLTRTASGTNLFILGNTDYGKLGTNELGDTGLGAETNKWVAQNQNVYTEDFVDADFKDAGNTTASWTTTGNCTFTSGQVATSSSIDYANGTITTATMTVTKSSGTFVYEMSANGGSNWDTVTSGVAKTFGNSGTDLKWRITEDAASTGTVTQVSITNYH